jgi:hypothetical protein
MDQIESKFIHFIKTTDASIEHHDYCNTLASEILQIIELQHKGLYFKRKKYSNQTTLHHNMAKYYVQAFQIYYAIEKMKEIELIMRDIEESQLKQDKHAYTFIKYVESKQNNFNILHSILSSLFQDTFLPTLEEMDTLVLETKKNISDINLRQIFYLLELY